MVDTETVDADRDYMQRALRLAERGLGRTSPNPMVGAVVVRAGVVVGQGYHERAGEPHAEAHALRAAGEQARGATLYSTLEPCCHTGRTGPCVEQIVSAGIARVVAAMEDPNPLVNGQGLSFMRARGIAIDVGMEQEAALRLNRPFVTWLTRRRPFVIMKIATSLDGAIAADQGLRTRLTGDLALRHAQRVRAEVDGVAIGARTVVVDDPILTVRSLFRERPLVRIVFDRSLSTPPTARLFETVTSGPVVVLTTTSSLEGKAAHAEALRNAGAFVQPELDGGVRSAFEWLAGFGLTTVVLEGGATLHGLAWDARVVDRVQVYIAPVSLGAHAVPWLDVDRIRLSELANPTIRPLGPDVLIEGDVYRSH